MKKLLRLIDEKKYVQVRRTIIEENVVDLADFIEEIKEDTRAVLLFRLLPKEMAAEVFAYLKHDVQQRIVEAISDKELSSILDNLFLDDTVDFIEEMPASIVQRVIKMSNVDARKKINYLLMYPEDSAGSLMTTELMKLESHWTVAEAISAVRHQASNKETIATLFVTDDARHLAGVLNLHDLLMAKDNQRIEALLETEAIYVNTHHEQEEVAELFKKYDLLTLPVVDTENRLVGVITIDDIVDVMEEETTEDIYKMAAMEPMEETYMNAGVITLARKRIVWLMVLMISATFTGIIIQNYSEALAANVLLASFIPMLMDTSGNAGSQASVSVIRGIVLGEIEFKKIFTVMWKEFRVSLLVGVGIAVFNFVRIVLLYRDYRMALVVAITIFCAVVAAKLVGCTLPLIATKLKLDPALMASPMITTIVDAVALLVYFNVASVLIPVV